MLSIFSWLSNLFRSPRMKQAGKLVRYAVPIVESISGMDWDFDGRVNQSKAVDEIMKTLADFAPLLRMTTFGEYLDASGRPDFGRLTSAAPSVIKKLLAMTRLVPTLLSADENVPSFSLLDTICQLALEQLKSK